MKEDMFLKLSLSINLIYNTMMRSRDCFSRLTIQKHLFVGMSCVSSF